MNLKRLLAVILVAAMAVTVLFSCGDSTKGGTNGGSSLSADECLDKIFESNIPKVEKTTVATTVNIISAGSNDPYNRITYNSIVSPTSESYVKLEVMDPAGFKTDMAVYSGSNGAVVTSRMFDSNYLVSVDFLKGYLADMGETGQAIGGILTGELGSITQNAELSALVSKYAAFIKKAMSDSTDKKLVVTDDSVGVTVTLDTDGIAKIVKDIYSEAKNDQTLKELILSVAETADPESYNEFASEYEEFFGSDTEVNEIVAGINEYADLELVLTVTADKSYKLNGITAELSANENLATLKYTSVTSDGQTVCTLSLEAEGVDLVEPIEYALVETKTESDENAYSLDLYIGELMLPLINVTRQEENGYVLTVSDEYILEGTYTSDETKTEITVKKLVLGDETVFLNVTLTVEYSVKLPTFPTSYKTLSELSAEEINALIETVKTNRTVSNLYLYFSQMLEGSQGNVGEALPDEA